MLNEKELKAKEIMESRFVPILHSLFEEANPIEYERWGKNCCRQTAIFGASLLKELLPEYKWSVWDGIFDDVVYGKPRRYNHAWIYGQHIKDKDRKLLVDLARLHQERLFMLTEDNKYPSEHESYKHMVELTRQKLDIKEHLQVKEYYTKRSSKILLQELKEMVLKGCAKIE